MGKYSKLAQDIAQHSNVFFWNSGTREQKSQIGLLRSLLHQVLNKNPELVPIVFPILWAQTYSECLDLEARKARLLGAHRNWSLRDLKIAFDLLGKQDQIPLKMFFLVDGLDEFDGDHEELMLMFRAMTENGNGRVRICLSSRPWIVFEDNLNDCASLKMQNLTYKISTYMWMTPSIQTRPSND